MASRKKDSEEDNISFCSFSGEAYSSFRRKKICNLRQHSVEKAVQSLGEQQHDLFEPPRRFNESFHNFRFIVAMMAGSSFGAMILLRYVISVAILKMVDQSALYLKEHPNKTIEDFIDEGYTLGGEFNWDNEIQQMIMSWYMFAYTIPQVPFTKLGTIIGARLSIPICLSLCIISNMLTPIVAYWGWEWVIVLRLINGAGASAVLPIMLTTIENWMPHDEVSLGLTVAQFMQATLICLNPLISGYLSAIHWSYAFYIPALVTAVFCIIWLMVITDRPDQNWLVSQQEIDLICNCRNLNSDKPRPKPTIEKSSNNDELSKRDGQSIQFKATWLDILSVPTFYIYVGMWILYCSSYSGFNFVLPNYLRQFLKISIAHNGFYCTLIQTGCILSVIWPHPCLRLLQQKFNLSLTASRRITHVLLCCTLSFSWIYVGLFHDSQLFLFFLGRCFHGSNDIVVTGTVMTNFAKAGVTGLAFSMINTIGNLSVVVISTLTGWLLDKTNQSVLGWSIIFVTGGLFQVMMMLFYLTIRSEPVEFPREKKLKARATQSQVEGGKIFALDGITIQSNETKHSHS